MYNDIFYYQSSGTNTGQASMVFPFYGVKWKLWPGDVLLSPWLMKSGVEGTEFA